MHNTGNLGSNVGFWLLQNYWTGEREGIRTVMWEDPLKMFKYWVNPLPNQINWFWMNDSILDQWTLSIYLYAPLLWKAIRNIIA